MIRTSFFLALPLLSAPIGAQETEAAQELFNLDRSNASSRLVLSGVGGSRRTSALPLSNGTVDRKWFYSQLRKLKTGDSTDRAIRLLGFPDAIAHRPDTSPGAGLHRWIYGIKEGGRTETLGSFHFHDYFRLQPLGLPLPPPPASLISEVELCTAMERIYEGTPITEVDMAWVDPDPLNRIRATNYLLTLGDEKARAVLVETSRVHHHANLELWMYLIAYTLFDVPQIPGYMPHVYMGVRWPSSNTYKTEARRFPVILVGDVPFAITRQVYVGGDYTPFGWFMAKDFPKKVPLRSSPLRPADDPFVALKKLVGNGKKPWLRISHQNSDDNFTPAELLVQLLQLVRTAYPTEEGKRGYGWAPWSDFDRHHREFLKLGCHWDEEQQCYVRKDGSHDPIEPLEPRKYLD